MADEDLVARLRAVGQGPFRSAMRSAASGVHNVGEASEYAADRSEHLDRATRRSARSQRMFNASARASAGGLRLFGFGLGGITSLLAGAGLVSGIRKMGEEVQESVKSARLVEARIESTGGVAGVTAKHIDRLSAAVSRKTATDDEQIASNAAMLLTFKAVKAEGGIFDRAVKSAQDLAVDFGSAEGATKMLGKALNDPTNGMTALTRAGVQFTEQQADQIEKLQKSGDLLGAQKIVMAEVESQVKGSAASQRTAIDSLTTNYDNLMESLGKLGAPAANRWLTVMARAVADVDDIVNDKAMTWPQKFDAIREAMVRRFSPLASEIGDAIEDADLPGKLDDAIEFAVPRIITTMANAAPKAAGAFVRAWWDASIWGKLVTVGFLATKMGPVFSLVGTLMMRRMVKNAAAAMVAQTAITTGAVTAGTAAGTAGGAAGGRSFGTAFLARAAAALSGVTLAGVLGGAFTAAGVALGGVLASAASSVITDVLQDLLGEDEGGLFGMAVLGPLGPGAAFATGQTVTPEQVAEAKARDRAEGRSGAGSKIGGGGTGNPLLKDPFKSMGARPGGLPSWGGSGGPYLHVTVPVKIGEREFGRASARIAARDLSRRGDLVRAG